MTNILTRADREKLAIMIAEGQPANSQLTSAVGGVAARAEAQRLRTRQQIIPAFRR